MVVGVMLLVIGAVVLLFGLYSALLVRRLRQHGIRTSGRVVDQKRKSTRGGTFWVPIISFTDQHGRTVTFQPSVGGKGYPLPTGQKVPVVYLANNPKKARVDMRQFMISPLSLMTLFGLVILGVGVAKILMAS